MPIRPEIQVRGLKELARKVRAADKGLARELQQTNKQVAQRVADTARPLVPVLTGRAASTVKARASGQRSVVVGGGPQAPYYPWLEFGGTIRPKGTPIVRKKVKAGRYLFPTVAKERDRNLDSYVDALNDILRRSKLT